MITCVRCCCEANEMTEEPPSGGQHEGQHGGTADAPRPREGQAVQADSCKTTHCGREVRIEEAAGKGGGGEVRAFSQVSRIKCV